MMRVLICMVLAWAALTIHGETVDPRVRTFVPPVRIVAAHNAAETAKLLEPKHGQVSEGTFCSSTGTVLTGGDSWFVLDFGKELHGGVQLGISPNTTKGARVRLRFGESVAEAFSVVGADTATNDHAMRDFELTVPWFGQIEVGNTGFRFLRIDLVQGGCVGFEFVRAVALMRPMKAVGSFRSSDERLNAVFETSVRTAHLCCQDLLWDGIKRDRLVWMGDTHPETMALLNVFGAAEVVPQTLDYVVATTPPEGWANGFPTYTLWWIRNLAAWYRFTGDKAYLKRHADYLEKVYAHVRTLLPEGVWQNTGEVGSFLDWPTHYNSQAEQSGSQALAVLAVEDVKFLAEALGRTMLAGDARDLLTKMRRTRPEPFGAKSSAALLALSGLRTPQEMYTEVLGQNRHAGVSTFYGYYMIDAMSLAGKEQRALDTVRDYWGGMLDMGATSFWEDFNLAWTNNAFRIDEMPVPGKKDVHGDYGDFCYKGFRHSLCHGWSAGPAAWCINRVLGIRPLAAGCKVVEVKPCLGDLAWAEGAMALPTGEVVKVRAERGADGRVKVDVSAPSWVTVEKR